MPSGLFQRSFAGGEVSDSISARAEVVKRTGGARTVFNGFPSRSGAFLNRSGTKFVNEVKDSTTVVDPDVVPLDVPEHLVPFIFSVDQAYILEFGHEYIRIHRFGEPVLITPSAWSGAIDYTVGDTVTEAGTAYYAIQDNTNQQPPDTEYWYAMPAAPSWYDGAHTALLEIPTPYQAGEITKRNTEQSADVLYITHRLHAPRKLQRFSDVKWSLVSSVFRPAIGSPGGLTTTPAADTNLRRWWRYTVTAVSGETGDESVVGHLDASETSTIDTAGDDDIVVDETDHGLVTGDRIYISAVTPSADINGVLVSALNERDFFVDRIDDDSFSLRDTSGIPYTFAHDIVWHRTRVAQFFRSSLDQSSLIRITWDDVPGASEYRVYANSGGQNIADPNSGDPGIYGYIGSSIKASFDDTGISPDFETTPPYYPMRFERQGRHPHLVSFLDQRLVFAASVEFPRSVWMSTAANFDNFAASSPPKDDDAIEVTLSGKQANTIQQVLGFDSLVILTLGNEQALRGDTGYLKASEIPSTRVHGYNGASVVKPVEIGTQALYVQRDGSQVRSIRFDDVQQSYGGEDLTIFASHLVDGRQVIDMAFAQTPHAIVWAPRLDGVLLGMTFIPEHELAGWHRHETATLAGQSSVLSVAVIPEDGVSILYMIVQRVVNGETVRYVEKMVRRCTSWTGF